MMTLSKYPLHEPHSQVYQDLVASCQADLAKDGMFTLDGFLPLQAMLDLAQKLAPRFASESFHHKRSHNIYFKHIPDLPEDHPANAKVETSNRTLCNDQLGDTLLEEVYNSPDLQRFLADVMGKPALYPMDDPLAAYNVMRYGAGEALNWHFDRSEFTTTLLIQGPTEGGAFEYRTDLRSDDDPNYDGVAALLQGRDPDVQCLNLFEGSLNVFRGKNTAHRVTPVVGDRPRMIAVLSYYETQGVAFSGEERRGFYGRA